jgi:outer membrane protein TolC
MRRSLLLLLFVTTQVRAETTLIDFLQSAWQKSPVIAGETSKNEESEQFVKSARGKYFPHVSLAGIDSTGFPASSSALRVGGIMGSPYRAGLAGGVIVEQTVYDFGRINSVLEAAKADKSLNEARLASEKLRFLTELGGLYLSCARTKSLLEENEHMMFWAKLILRETGRFTKTGQRSIIDNSLVKSKLNDLELQEAELKRLQASLIYQMKIYAEPSGCAALQTATVNQVPENLKVEEPSMLLAKAQVEVSRAGVENAKSAQLPTLNVMGSAGGMDHARLVDQQDYSASVGLVFPIWNGGEDQHREQAYKSQVEYQSQLLKTTELEFQSKLKNLIDERDRFRESLQQIDQNLAHVRETMKLASKRYQRLEGPLIDVRDAYSELQTIEYQRVGLQYNLATASLQLSLLKTTGL